jgi:adenylylsulfate kinase-like enzyme
MARDPKGIYRQGHQGLADTVPGLQVIYEPPERPELVVHADQEDPEVGSAHVIGKLAEIGYLAELSEHKNAGGHDDNQRPIR